jgi:hypothetical protein
MNLHAIAAGYVGAVNPPLLCQLQPSTGYTQTADGTQVPAYGAIIELYTQLQALTYQDLMKMQGLNIAGVRKAGYLYGAWDGVVRSASKGGDLLTTPDGNIWLCAYVLENWDISANWTKVVLTQQNGS